MKSKEELMIQLDMMLTYHNERDCRHTMRGQKVELDTIYYLSDGGYSRIHITWEGKLHPTSSSLERVHQNWDRLDVQSVVADIERALGEQYEKELMS
jgi:hypothetical protein